MSSRTTYVGVLCPLAFALALSGCGAAADASPGDDADPEVGSVAEALTTQFGIMNAGEGNRLDWANGTATMFVASQHSDIKAKIGVWTDYLKIINNNQARLHMRKIQIDLICSSEPNLGGTQIQTEFMFSGYVSPNGGIFERYMYCPYAFGFPYLVKTTYYTESSYGD